ncbi:MAG TPA: heme ABC exporter ATP-binding protein CcmA, partial [Methylomirabilota bacterium]|nr:heme ABC exporter ATP-binding protein CcmA [Methylomirabilota bacterium]
DGRGHQGWEVRPMIEVAGLSKVYGRQVALRGVTLSVPAGAILTVVGHNGSGKSTLVRILATLTRPTAGHARVAGHDVVADRDRVRHRIGLLGHGTHLYDDLTGRENLAFAAALAGHRPGRDELTAVLARVGLDRQANTRVRELSSGMRRRVALARAILCHPQVLLLDEPFAGLDQESTKRLEDYLHTFRAEGGAAVVVTHSLTRALAISDRVAILAAGRLAADAPRDHLTTDGLQRLYLTATEGSA